MRQLLGVARRFYRGYVRGATYFGDLLLLVVRLYWGSQLVISGGRKFVNLNATAQWFAGLDFPWPLDHVSPTVNAIASGCVEFGFGLLLVIGLAARIAAVPLAVNMLVAFAANNRDRFLTFFSSPNDFVTAPEFLYLLACLLVLAFGPGAVSVDSLACILLGRLPAEGGAAREILRTKKSSEISAAVSRGRREFAKLVAAAAAGLCAGLLLRSGGGGHAKDHTARAPDGAAGGKPNVPTTANAALP
ncbi:MAG TPA: DoxX family protein, partial [Pirellulales bacterium]|nr:DoxX family protein [Pirellulales bacterium]